MSLFPLRPSRSIAVNRVFRFLLFANCCSSSEQAHQAFGFHVRNYEFFGVTCGLGYGFGCQVAATDCAFHGGGPSGGDPVSGEEETRPLGVALGTILVQTWRH